MERFPTVEALADVDEESVLKVWEGLGYYSRARNLRRSALIVRETLGGVLPQDSKGLKTLPGIGEYSAGAIASIAYGEVVPAVDGNVRRVLSRLFDLEDPTDASLRKRAVELVDPDRPGDWNQALMELGATVCTPRSPRCTDCPLKRECRAMAEGTQELRPASKRRPRVRTVSYAVLVAPNPEGELLMVRRPPDGLLGGLWEFPAVELGADAAALSGGALIKTNPLHERCRVRLEDLGVRFASETARLNVLPEVGHRFTHLKAVYRPMLVAGVRLREGEGIGTDLLEPSGVLVREEHEWVTPERFEHLPLPVAQRKIFELARGALAGVAVPA
jgi:A/G-specific adenine glycosylase